MGGALIHCLRLWLAALALIAAAALPGSLALAQQSASPATVQLNDQQLDQIVTSVTRSVLQGMKGGEPASPAVEPGGARPTLASEEGFTFAMQEWEDRLLAQLGEAVRAYPDLIAEVGRIAARIDQRPQGWGPAAFLGIVAIILAAALAVAAAGAAAARHFLADSSTATEPASIAQVLRRAAASLTGFALFWVIVTAATAKLFSGSDMQSAAGHWLLSGAAQFALPFTIFAIWFRPSAPAYRLVPLETPDARLAMRLFVTIIAVAVVRSWILIPLGDDQPEPVIAAGLLINNLLFVSSFFAAAIPARQAVARWIANAALGGKLTPFRRWLAANWLAIAGCGVIAVSAVHAYGAVAGRAAVVAGLTGTVLAVIAMILVCSLIEFLGRRAGQDEQAQRRAIPRLPGLVSQMLRVFITLGAAVYFIKLWAVDALEVMSPSQWSDLAGYAFEPLAALFGGYLAISYVNYASMRYLAAHPQSAAKVNEDGEVVARGDGSSRLRTLIPILRITSNVVIAVMITLLVLSQLGFNITPLLAGASVIGLAISFGSQALVKDIVSGVLFLAEDSFRIGEYIVCGSAAGTVEGFTLRSVRLRHQDGQIFTVPFGQIGEIVNFSRDWATVKFNMSLDRDVDLEDVRRVTASVAAQLKADFRERLLDTLKVQGVKDVTDNAIVVQFKLTSLPRDPGEIERSARSRLLRAFRDEGIALSRSPWLAAATAQPA